MSEGMMCMFYICCWGMSLICMWVGFFAGVYASDLYKFLKPRLSRRRNH